MKNLMILIAVGSIIWTSSCTKDALHSDAASGTDLIPADARTSLPQAEESIDNMPSTEIHFDKTEYDFGIMQKGEKQQTVFRFSNRGLEPLIISSAKGSCGCTVPEWPKQPIAPGESAEMVVEFTAKTEGTQTKTVTIQANTDPNPTRLKIMAEVMPGSGAQ